MNIEKAIKLLEEVKSRVECLDVYIDKEEGEALDLAIKALDYDRKQYEKGYEDARKTFSASLPLHDAVYNYLLSHEVSEVLEVVLEAIKEYER